MPLPLRIARSFRFHAGMIIVGLCGVLWLLRAWWWPIWFENSARAALRTHENRRALADLEWATLLAPATCETEFLRARAYRRMGDVTRSLALLKKARSTFGSSERLTREEWFCQAQSGQMNRVEKYVPELLKDPRGDTDEVYEAFFLGTILKNQYSEAHEILNSWVQASPKNARPYGQRARLWLLRSKNSRAIEDFQRAVELNPLNYEDAVELAMLHQDRNEFTEAIPLFERCLNDPKVAVRAQTGLAICLKSIGDNRRVRSLLEAAVKESKVEPQPLCELGRWDLETGHYASAVVHLTEAVRRAPQDDESHFVLAQALVADGKLALATPHFEFAKKFRDDLAELTRCKDLLSRNPRDVELLMRAALIELKGPDTKQGIMRLFSVLEIDPNHKHAKDLLTEHFAAAAKTNPEFRDMADKLRAGRMSE